MYRYLVCIPAFIATFHSLSAEAANGLLPSGQCAVVVASRPSIPAARQYIYENGRQGGARVFESSNGWFAITSGMIPNTGSSAAVERMKRAGSIPGDAYCSTGSPYVREVAWQSNRRDTSSPVSTGLWADFDARPLTTTEKRFLQAALAMAGHYNGLLDGVWGHGSQSALEQYTATEFDGQEPTNAHAGYLTSSTFMRWANEGWNFENIGRLGISMMLPVDQLVLVEKDGLFEHRRRPSGDLEIMFGDLSDYGLRDLHGDIASRTDAIGSPYTHRARKRWVTSLQTRSGSVYARSDLIAGTWSTISVMARRSREAEVGLIASSIRVGRPTDIVPPENGRLLAYAAELGAALADRTKSATPAPSPVTEFSRSVPSKPSEESETPRGSTGTAFYVTDDGIALTNAHVVQDCSELTLGEQPAEIVSVSTAFDLAAIRLLATHETIPLRFAEDDAALNADITVAGYPLHGLLGGLNVSRGSVSSMKGLGGDETSIQISAPVQPGNSGGPAIGSDGNVVGVVVAKLNVIALADATGDIAQNVNFAIRGSLAKVFLSSNGIDFDNAPRGESIPPEEVAELLQAATALVECR